MSRISKSVDREKVHQWLPRLEGAGEKWRVTANGYGIPFVGDKNVLKLIMVIVAQLCEYIKNH